MNTLEYFVRTTGAEAAHLRQVERLRKVPQEVLDQAFACIEERLKGLEYFQYLTKVAYCMLSRELLYAEAERKIPYS